MIRKTRFNADRDECLARFGYDKPPPPLTQQQSEELYAKLLTVADCVRSLGYEVPEPPSEQAFVAHMMRSPIPPWHPYDALYDARDFNGLVRVQQDCPAR